MRRILLACICASLLSLPLSRILYAERSWADVYIQVAPSIGLLTTIDEEGGEGECSVFSIDAARQLFMSADHCFNPTLAVNGMKAWVVYRDTPHDFMVVQSFGVHARALKLAPHAPRTGDEIAAIGHAGSIPGLSIRIGRVQLPDTLVTLRVSMTDTVEDHFMVVDFRAQQGMSGGPVVNRRGEVVSIIQIGYPEIGFGRPLTALRSTAPYWEGY